MDEDRILDDNSRYGISQIFESVVLSLYVGLIFYGLTLPILLFTFGGFFLFIFVVSILVHPLLPLGVLLLSPGVGGLIGSYIGYKYGLGMRLCTPIGAIVFSLLPIILVFFG